MLIEVDELNDLLQQGFSFRQICQTKNLKRSTLQGQLKKEGYVLKDNQYVIDGSLAVQSTGKNEISLLDTRVTTINNLLKDVTKKFCLIAYEMYILHSEFDKDKFGCSSFSDFSKDKFGLGKTQTYNFLNLAKFCLDINSNGVFKLKDEYENYTFTQLVEILSLPDEVKKEVTPDMSVKEIKEKKKKVKTENHHDQLEGQQTFVEAEFKSVDELKESNKLKVDLSLSISILEVAWSNEVDDNKAEELRKQIDYIRSLN